MKKDLCIDCKSTIKKLEVYQYVDVMKKVHKNLCSKCYSMRVLMGSRR